MSAEQFARDWIRLWNARDLEGVLAHYADEIVMHSPRIAVVTGENKPSVNGKSALRRYWRQALDLAPDLHFNLDMVLAGSDALTILYHNHRGDIGAESLVFGPDGLAVKAVATYR